MHALMFLAAGHDQVIGLLDLAAANIAPLTAPLAIVRHECAARLQVAYGVWLRRQRRAAESREPLRAARDSFDALGAVIWSERARQELRAAGETSRRREPGLLEQLSTQELQVAQMAADGLSNREIGQKLYLSHRTISSHLYRAYPKLGITSRAQLRDVVGQSARTGAAA